MPSVNGTSLMTSSDAEDVEQLSDSGTLLMSFILHSFRQITQLATNSCCSLANHKFVYDWAGKTDFVLSVHKIVNFKDHAQECDI